MKGPEGNHAPVDERRECVERILANPILHGSDSLNKLLRYLADHALSGDLEQIKEYQIAREVFGRGDDFDPRLDSIARVQASRLRTKLAEYYAGEGAHDTWHIELPRGGYTLTFKHREEPAMLPEPAVVPVVAKSSYGQPFRIAVGVAAALAILLGVSTYRLLRTPRNGPPSTSPALTEFWGSLLRSEESPLVIYSNAEFVGRPETGLRYRRPEDPDVSVFESYTGVGEVMAVDTLNKVFNRLGRALSVKRARLLNWDETKNRAVIFIGSPSENLPVRDLPLSRHFAFRFSEGPERKGDLGIVNLHPQPGEQKVYYASGTFQVTEEYALIEAASGPSASQTLLLLAGTTTYGTQGAAEFVCTEDQVAALLKRLDPTHLNKPRQFSALIRVRVQRGVPLQSEVVAMRRD
ncbi:hypothetical protein [uncultured Paludibaculum sp.]|uniref:hypothetical protein n=1 Tax=uncultured Paludibaculum sp. TaxID=1765020 RepID=UPI002AAB9A92|nr:hypothetical protein [uncultured Paludibaculum sp.]